MFDASYNSNLGAFCGKALLALYTWGGEILRKKKVGLVRSENPKNDLQKVAQEKFVSGCLDFRIPDLVSFLQTPQFFSPWPIPEG